MTKGTADFEQKQYQSIQSQVAYLRRKGLVPKEKTIEVGGGAWRSGRVAVTLRDRPEWQYAPLRPIEIPTSLRNPSEPVTTLQRREDRLGMTAACFRRALLIAQALDAACTERGYFMKARGKIRYDWMDGPRYRDDPDYAGHLQIEIGENSFVLALSQEAQPMASARPGYGTVQNADRDLNQAVRIRIVGSRQSFWRSTWSESEHGSGTEFLPRLMQELELRAKAADDRRRSEEEERLKTQREWEVTKLAAREQVIRDRKLRLLHDQLHRRKLVDELETYLDELRARVSAMDDRFRSKASDWIEWVSDYRAEIDPRSGPMVLPQIEEPSASDLAPYMDGWSTTGPHKLPLRQSEAYPSMFPGGDPWHPNRREWP
jgi:hypothetical protein